MAVHVLEVITIQVRHRSEVDGYFGC
jgi:hypothetical protein